MINKIHFFWTPPSGARPDLPADITAVLQAWNETHPNFQQKIWGTEDISVLCLKNNREDIVNAINSSLYPAMKSDIARLVLMVYEGGVYSDLKNYPVKSFLLDFLSLNKPVITQHPPTIPNHEKFICNAFFCGQLGHQFFCDLLDYVISNVASRKPTDIHGATGGGALMKVLGSPMRTDVIVKLTEEVWGTSTNPLFMKRISASYNGVGYSDHWSKKQQKTGIYTS